MMPDDVSRETLDRLKHYEELLRKWNPKINLVSRSTLDVIWERHILDSMQVFGMAVGKSWVDLGSGGGFPGCVIAILANELAPEMAVTMVESDQRKAVFLRTVLREVGVRASVVSERIELAEPQCADVVSARALADLRTLLEFYERHAADDACAVFMKGAKWEEEVKAAQEQWNFDYKAVSSKSEPNAVILQITGATRV